MLSQSPLKGIIFDLGDVLFTWSANTTTSVPAKTLRNIISSDIWVEYDCGRVSQDECYDQAAQQFSIPTSELREAFAQARDSLQSNHDMITFIHEMKKTCEGMLKVFAMSNISREDYAVLATKVVDWAVFDKIFTSGHSGMRKPNSNFYKHVLREVGLNPQEVIFVDDKVENVVAAETLGIRSMVFSENKTVIRALRQRVENPFERGYRYLQQNGKRFDSITDSGVTIPDNFAMLLIQEVMQFDNFVEAKWDKKKTWNFFIGNPILVPEGYFPDDLDTTSLALMVLQPEKEVVTSMLDEMLEYVHPDGKFQTYFDRSKPRTDEIVSANVLACFYHFGRGHQLGQTLEMVHEVLLHRTYLRGTRYYPCPDCCLFFFNRLLQSSDDVHLKATLGSLLKDRAQERVGESGNTIELAMRIIAGSSLGIDCSIDVRALLACQSDDGGWQAGWMYRYGSTGVRLGNRGVTTAMAVKAITSSRSYSKLWEIDGRNS